jgi:hypothetical protein
MNSHENRGSNLKMLSLLAAAVITSVAFARPARILPRTRAFAAPPQATGPSASQDASAGAPAFRVPASQLSSPPVIISYGDTRFTDPSDTKDTNPKVRQWLVNRIAAEKPDVLLLGGDVPMHGGVAADYAVFASETAPWRAAHLIVFPTLGNHEFYKQDRSVCAPDPQPCLGNWWNAFPQLRGRRWYSVEIGDRIRVLNLDSDMSLFPGSEQAKWIEQQLKSLPASVQFVFFNLHHPPVADPIPNGAATRHNEQVFAEFLERAPQRDRAQFIVIGAHIHEYERFLRNGVTYLVSGGGGAAQTGVVRGPDDLYHDTDVHADYHYIKWTLRKDRIDAQMFRLANPNADVPAWDVRDRFQIKAK